MSEFEAIVEKKGLSDRLSSVLDDIGKVVTSRTHVLRAKQGQG